MTRLVLVLLLLAWPLHAQTVSVKSGEHDGFTRLVLTYPAPFDWMLGRSPRGYGLRIEGPALRYDLTSVYQLITKDRLRSIWVDPVTGILDLGVECACHALPFELSSTVLVIDIRDGAPPPGSSFEIGLQDGISAPPIQPAPRPRPRRSTRMAGSYDWLQIADQPTVTDPSATPTGLENDRLMNSFRNLLITELGRAATQGVVQMARPTSPPDPTVQPLPENARAAIDALPGVGITADNAGRPDLMVQGDLCPPPDALDLGSWASSGDAAAELARARSNLLTEFDTPVPEQILAAVNTHLHFGFGAEARALMTTILPRPHADPQRLALSYLVDGDPPPENPFRDMQSCDSGAALWSLLAAAPDDNPPYLNGAAVSQAFLSLPLALRSFLGPDTVRRLARLGDDANAEIVRASFVRASAADDPTIGLLAADQALQAGDPATAETLLPPQTDDETGLLSLLSLIEARFQQRKPVDGKDIVALQAFAFEQANGPHSARLVQALAHASALGGDFDSAFGHAAAQTGLERDIWALLAEIGADSALLIHAVGADPVVPGQLPIQLRTQMAERLLRAGLPNAALIWAPPAEADTDLAARIALANGDARGALRLVALQTPQADPALLAASYTALGDYSAAATAYLAAGVTDQATRLQRWAGAAPVVDASADPGADDPWAALSRQIGAGAGQTPLPPLQAGADRLDQSLATRQAITALLTAAPSVPGPPP